MLMSARTALAAALLFAAPAAHAAGDAKKGEALVKTRCSSCHAVAADAPKGLGPSLAGVASRRAGSLPAFNYSAAMKSSKLTWNAANLDQFLASPSKKIPGTSMMIATPNAKDRADIVAYLSTLRR